MSLLRLKDVYQSILSFDLPIPSPPVIDAAPSHVPKNALPGLRFLRDEVKRDYELLRQHANSPSLSTNAPYLIAVWDELVHARHPVAIYRTFFPARKDSRDKTHAVKVDVVAENGARWVRVNTIKNARLIMEFREMDSYLTSSDEDDTRPRLVQTGFDNSVLRMGRELLATATANPILVPTPVSGSATTMTPQVTFRLTRLNPFDDDNTPDPRIGMTIQCLCDMGIDVQLGECSYPNPSPIPKTPATFKLLEPTTNINLDLSALIALISDISHSPLPRSEQEARARFGPTQSYLDWKRDRVKSLARQNQTTHHSPYDAEDAEDDEGTSENSGQHSRALAARAIQEMGRGILEEIHDRMSTHPSASVMFWTTSEARHRCLQIVSKIGGERERLRADALLCSMLCARTPPVPAPAHIRPNGVSKTYNMERKAPADAYWEHSRYSAGFLPLVPVRVYPSILPAVEEEGWQSTFFDALARACTGILSHEVKIVPAPHLSAPLSMPTPKQALEEKPPAAQTSLPKLTVHTVTSMLAGASRGYTTLTTNRSSVKEVLKEMRRACGSGGYEPAPTGAVERAALWVLDPRSLSEGMRSE